MSQQEHKVYRDEDILFINMPGLFVELNSDGGCMIYASNVRMSWSEEKVQTVLKLFSTSKDDSLLPCGKRHT